MSASGGEQRQVRLALAAQEREIDLDAADPPGLRERDRLRLQLLRREDAAAPCLRGIGADEAEVAGQLENAALQESFIQLVFAINQGGLGPFVYRMAQPDQL